MMKLLKKLSLSLVLLVPAIATGHEGHGLPGTDHYHTPFDLNMVLGLVVVGLIAIGVKYFLDSRK